MAMQMRSPLARALSGAKLVRTFASSKELAFSTRIIHAGSEPDAQTGA